MFKFFFAKIIFQKEDLVCEKKYLIKFYEIRITQKDGIIKNIFVEPKAAICGNGVVEEGEECDCGWEEDCRDQCCFPMRRYAPVDEPPCKLTPRSICSPSQVEI